MKHWQIQNFRSYISFLEFFCRKLYELSRRKPGWRFTAGFEFRNMFDNSFSIIIIFPQVQCCQEAWILNPESSRRIEKSNKVGFVSLEYMKNEKTCKFLKVLKSVENINASFSISNYIVFCFWKIRMSQKTCSNIEKPNLQFLKWQHL